MASKKFSKKLKELRKKAGYTQKEVYEYFNIPQSTFSSWEIGKSEPSAEMLMQLCAYYNCNMMEEFIGTVEDVIFTNRELELLEKYRYILQQMPEGAEAINVLLEKEYEIAQQIAAQKDYIKKLESELSTELIPTRIISYCQRLASAGNGEYLFEDVPTDVIKVMDSPEARKADFVIGVNGDSMEPDYYNGEKVFVEKTPDIEVGEVGVFVQGSECYIKECGEHGLISRNKKYPGVEPLSEGIKIVGRVIGKAREIK